MARLSSFSRKFLRKPNVAEGSEQFGNLAKDLKSQESNQYAAFCCLAQARCEHTLANAAGEAQCLVEAGRNFLQAETGTQLLKCPGFQEHLDAAINCYSHAIRVQIENKQPALAASLCLEVGDALQKLNKCSEAIPHYQRAADLQSYSILDCLSALGLVASSKLEIKDYEGALSGFTEISEMIVKNPSVTGGNRPLGAYADILARCQVTRVLLLMLLKPTAQRIRPEHAQTLELYSWHSTATDNSPTHYMHEDLFLLLQSVVIACQSKDTKSLKALQRELWPRFSVEQNQLVHLVVESLETPPGEGI